MPPRHFSWTQFFPPKATFTDQAIPANLQGKVYLVTGANSGMGKELARILYSRHAKVYAACRSEERGRQAIADIKKVVPASKGELVFLGLDLTDLAKTQAAAQEFLARESRLHVLFNNAGVMVAPTQPMPMTVQGHELSLGVNCIATFLFTKLLTPVMVDTAKVEPPNTVRVIWVSSFALEQFAPEGRGVDMSNLDYHKPTIHIARYGISKAGDWLLAVEYARRHRADGIVSVPLNPGNLKSDLGRGQAAIVRHILGLILYPVVNGAYTQLFAAFSSECDIGKVDWTKQWGMFDEPSSIIPRMAYHMNLNLTQSLQFTPLDALHHFDPISPRQPSPLLKGAMGMPRSFGHGTRSR